MWMYQLVILLIIISDYIMLPYGSNDLFIHSCRKDSIRSLLNHDFYQFSLLFDTFLTYFMPLYALFICQISLIAAYYSLFSPSFHLLLFFSYLPYLLLFVICYVYLVVFFPSILCFPISLCPCSLGNPFFIFIYLSCPYYPFVYLFPFYYHFFDLCFSQSILLRHTISSLCPNQPS